MSKNDLVITSSLTETPVPHPPKPKRLDHIDHLGRTFRGLRLMSALA